MATKEKLLNIVNTKIVGFKNVTLVVVACLFDDQNEH